MCFCGFLCTHTHTPLQTKENHSFTGSFLSSSKLCLQTDFLSAMKTAAAIRSIGCCTAQVSLIGEKRRKKTTPPNPPGLVTVLITAQFKGLFPLKFLNCGRRKGDVSFCFLTLSLFLLSSPSGWRRMMMMMRRQPARGGVGRARRG